MNIKKETATVQIRQIAERLQLSPGTVSIVLNGRGDSMRISKATQQRVQAMAKEMNYQPNMNARRLRQAAGEKASYIIAVYWCNDFLDELLGKFFQGAYLITKNSKLNVEIVVQPYEFNELKKYRENMNSNRYNGVIIGGASEDDLSFMEAMDFNIPIILMNRQSNKFSWVSISDYESGRKCAKLFAARGHKKAGILNKKNKGRGSRLRDLGFTNPCEEFGLEVGTEWTGVAEKRNFESGYQEIKKFFMAQKDTPTALFVMDNGLIGGVLMALKENNIRVPEDMEIIVSGDDEALEYTTPTVTSLRMPMLDMAKSALEMMLTMIENNISIPMNRILVPDFIIRQSCGDFPELEDSVKKR